MDTKRCPTCATVKPVTEFWASKSKKDGRCSQCVTCMKAYRAERRDYYTAKHREWVGEHRDQLNEYNREYLRNATEDQKAHHRKMARERLQRVRYEVIAAYGGFCACCGETEIRFLQMDHINNDGAAHRKEIKIQLSTWLKQQGYPEGFQVLCANCNFAKHTNGGTCPHQERMDECLQGSS
jgi:hypothetical protein